VLLTTLSSNILSLLPIEMKLNNFRLDQKMWWMARSPIVSIPLIKFSALFEYNSRWNHVQLGQHNPNYGKSIYTTDYLLDFQMIRMKLKNLLLTMIVSTIAILGIVGAGCLGNGGTDTDTVYWLQVPPVDQKAQLVAGNIDGGIAWEPYPSDVLLSGSASIYKWSEEIWPDHPCCVIAVDQDYLADNEELVLRMLKAHMVANDWIQDTVLDPDGENYTKLLEMGAEFSSRNGSVVASSLEHMELKYQIDAQFIQDLEMITDKYIDLGLISEQTIHGRGYSDVDDFVNSYVDPTFLESAAHIEPVDSVLNPDDPMRLGYLVGDLHHFAKVVASNDTIWGEGKDLYEIYGVATRTSEGGPYANGGYEMDAFAAGYVDVGYLGSPPAILKHLNAVVNTLIISQVNSVGSAIFVEPSITALEDFDGKTIATPGPASIQHLVFLDYFKENGFNVVAK
jgi:NitT/TauT family transport system substrate-binding protein